MKLFVPLLLLLASAGAQWQKLPIPTTAGFRGLSVVSEKVVWASGTDGTIIRTDDGGKTWSVMTVAGAEKLDFRGIRAFDDQTAVIISSGPTEKGQAQIYRTTDGGKTWKQVFEEKRAGIFFDAVAFWDRRHGIVLSDPIEGKFALFITDDGGLTWNQLPPAALPAALPNEGAFAASNSCLVVQGEKNVWFATGGAKVARVFRSNDRGRTWQVAETPMHPANASSGIFSLAFQDAKHGIAVGGDYQKPESSDLPNVLRTSDGGKTWQPLEPTSPKGVYFSSTALLSPHGVDSIVAVGINGAFMWDKSWGRVGDEGLNLNSVAVARGRVTYIWAVGPKGTVVETAVVKGLKGIKGPTFRHPAETAGKD
ncbi:MAG: oxidoreductase [Acidobacteriia bacterium]|nr:oxidoreductase [Terriglobia bacterium]